MIEQMALEKPVMDYLWERAAPYAKDKRDIRASLVDLNDTRSFLEWYVSTNPLLKDDIEYSAEQGLIKTNGLALSVDALTVYLVQSNQYPITDTEGQEVSFPLSAPARHRYAASSGSPSLKWQEEDKTPLSAAVIHLRQARKEFLKEKDRMDPDASIIDEWEMQTARRYPAPWHLFTHVSSFPDLNGGTGTVFSANMFGLKGNQ